jgi:CheY-like chemotaxis protein
LRPQVVLLDVLLPDTTGFEVAERLGSDASGPVVVLTSSRSADDFGGSARALQRARVHREVRPDRDPPSRRNRGRCGVRAVPLLVWLAGGVLSATMIAGAVEGPWPPADKAAIA